MQSELRVPPAVAALVVTTTCGTSPRGKRRRIAPHVAPGPTVTSARAALTSMASRLRSRSPNPRPGPGHQSIGRHLGWSRYAPAALRRPEARGARARSPARRPGPATRACRRSSAASGGALSLPSWAYSFSVPAVDHPGTRSPPRIPPTRPLSGRIGSPPAPDLASWEFPWHLEGLCFLSDSARSRVRCRGCTLGAALACHLPRHVLLPSGGGSDILG